MFRVWMRIARAGAGRGDWDFAAVADYRWSDENVDRMAADCSRQTEGRGATTGVLRFLRGADRSEETIDRTVKNRARQTDEGEARGSHDGRVAHSDILGAEI